MRLCAPRLSRRASALRVTASATVNILCKSRTRCQPGLKSRDPSTCTRAARAFNVSISDKALPQIFLVAKDAHKTLHRALQILMNAVRTLTIRPLERRKHLLYSILDLRRINRQASRSPSHIPQPPIPLAAQTPADRRANSHPADSPRAIPPQPLPPRNSPATNACAVSASTRIPPIM